jgi:hypothetical protein
MTVGSIGTFFSTTQWMNTTTSWSVTNVGNGDTLVIAYDADAGKIWFGRVASGGSTVSWYNTSGTADPSTGTDPRASGITAGKWFAGVGAYYTPSGASINYGQRPFAFTNAPSGFKALCTQNLPTPTIGATSTTQANDYFNVVLWTGDNTTPRNITGVGFQPDFVWIKARSAAYWHRLFDAVRGATKTLYSNVTDAEATTTDLTAFLTDGFTTNNTDVNGSGITYVAWNWNAGGSNATNTAGTITSTVRANTTSGFSIVTYTGNGTSGATVGHGLGVTPGMIIIKARTAAYNWAVWHTSLGGGNNSLQLNNTGGTYTAFNYWNSTSPSSTVFTLGNDAGVNQNTNFQVAYCFAPVAGYSAFGSYTGNGSTDGPFVYTGFRPRYLLVKDATAAAENWQIVDTARNTYNVAPNILQPNRSDAESAFGSGGFDILSNGFKIRTSSSSINTNGSTIIYAAFAESPFKYSLAR